jgi:hypothetical protein
VTTYQKTFLYEVDEAWAQEGPGFKSMYIEGLGQVRKKVSYKLTKDLLSKFILCFMYCRLD